MQIPVDADLLQELLNYCTSGSTPRCTFQQLNEMIRKLMAAAEAANAEAVEEAKPNGAASEHG